MAVTAKKVKLVIHQGSTYRSTLTCKSNGRVLDLTGCTIELKAVAADTPPMVYTTESGNITLTDPINGIISIHIPSTITGTYTWGSAKFDIHATFPNGDVEKLLSGTFKLDKRV